MRKKYEGKAYILFSNYTRTIKKSWSGRHLLLYNFYAWLTALQKRQVYQCGRSKLILHVPYLGEIAFLHVQSYDVKMTTKRIFKCKSIFYLDVSKIRFNSHQCPSIQRNTFKMLRLGQKPCNKFLQAGQNEMLAVIVWLMPIVNCFSQCLRNTYGQSGTLSLSNAGIL